MKFFPPIFHVEEPLSLAHFHFMCIIKQGISYCYPFQHNFGSRYSLLLLSEDNWNADLTYACNTSVPSSVINLKMYVFASLSIPFFVCQVDAGFNTFCCPRSSSLGVILAFRPFIQSLLLLIHNLKQGCKRIESSQIV